MEKFVQINSDGTLGAEYEGDYMIQDNQFVQILERTPDPNKGNKLLAAVHLAAGQSVKKI